MKKYITPEIEVFNLQLESVINSSSNNTNNAPSAFILEEDDEELY